LSLSLFPPPPTSNIWPDDLPRVYRSLSDTESFQGHVTDEETEDGKLWRVFHIGEQEYRVDMASVDPYKAVISHGGCFGENLTAIIVFSSCFLPESSLPDYENVMENLFRLRKNLKSLIVVHPSWFIKVILAITRPFIRLDGELNGNSLTS
ncbi:hypothetical protein scyTo_0019391, partial [Scyliorhinus torazame]|nr:hypothetical protein [Scyliorhinus torazame]